MQKNQIGSAEIISYRTMSKDPVYKYPIIGALVGTSISHIALRLTFNDAALFEKYIATNSRIPSVDNLIEFNSGKKMYQVYFSFWPSTDLNYQTVDSTLNNHIFDCEQSALGSPMSYNSRFKQYLDPDKSIVTSLLPILNFFVKSEITLPPSIIFHTTHFRAILNTTLASKTAEEREVVVNNVVNTGRNYSILYEAWSDAVLAKHNLLKSGCYTAAEMQVLSDNVTSTNTALLEARSELKDNIKTIMYPDQEISDANFVDTLEKFISFGKPEMETITLPLVKKSSSTNGYGLELEPMLQYIKKIADNPSTYRYNVISNNCATELLKVLDQGAKTCANRKIRNAFTLPWYARWFGFPVSPAMVMQLANNAMSATGMIQAESNVFGTIEQSCQNKQLHRKKSYYMPVSKTMLVLNSNKSVLNSKAASSNAQLSITQYTKI